MPRIPNLILLVLGLAFGAAGAVAEEGRPVVIELYTSQGCSSCPPADALLGELAKRDDVLPLALHVDYWDYIGWKDEFAIPAFTQRQKAYARAAGSRTIFTPQMIVDGTDHVVGNQPMQVMDLIQKHRDRGDPVHVSLKREGTSLRIEARAVGEVPAGMVVQMVRFNPHSTVSIERGENAGRTIDYVNVVREWAILETWNGQAPLVLKADAAGPVAVLVQAPDHGPMLGAARLD